MIKLKDILNEWGVVNTGPKRWGIKWKEKYTEFEKATNKELKEADIPEFSTRAESIEYEMNKIAKVLVYQKESQDIIEHNGHM